MAAADAKEEEPEERECRICRGEGEENNPLYVPCDCRGSIRYCHEDCLVRWLDHSGKDRCELCGIEFAFAPPVNEGGLNSTDRDVALTTFNKGAI